MTRLASGIAAAVLVAAGLGTAPQALAGDCTGRVSGVRPISSYDHRTGAGFLAVRRGPSSAARQIGEVYAGDLLSVYDRRGNRYHVTCMEGDCEDPLWGAASPSGWVSARYVRARGVCP